MFYNEEKFFRDIPKRSETVCEGSLAVNGCQLFKGVDSQYFFLPKNTQDIAVFCVGKIRI